MSQTEIEDFVDLNADELLKMRTIFDPHTLMRALLPAEPHPDPFEI